MTRDHARAMRVYAELAVLSHQRQQPLARDRFLLLCGAEACAAGWLDVAAGCHRLVRESQPAHQISRLASFPEALRDADGAHLIDRWRRWCPPERAEHLLHAVPRPAQVPAGADAGQTALQLLSMITLATPET